METLGMMEHELKMVEDKIEILEGEYESKDENDKYIGTSIVVFENQEDMVRAVNEFKISIFS